MWRIPAEKASDGDRSLEEIAAAAPEVSAAAGTMPCSGVFSVVLLYTLPRNLGLRRCS
jgi:hypothetical protein